VDERVRAEERSPADEVGEPLVPQGGQPGAVGGAGHRAAPVLAWFRERDLAVDLVDHEVEQLRLSGEVAVESHGPGVEGGADLAQRDAVEVLGVGERTAAVARESAAIQELVMAPDAAQRLVDFFTAVG
jgi:hypothetical protein